MTTKYPQHEKLEDVKQNHGICSEFFEFLASQDLLDESKAEALLAEFFDIDLGIFNDETEAMIMSD